MQVNRTGNGRRQWSIYKRPLNHHTSHPHLWFIMNALVLVVLLPVALAASIDQRIVNGNDVNIANYPWQVSVMAFFMFAKYRRRLARYTHDKCFRCCCSFSLYLLTAACTYKMNNACIQVSSYREPRPPP